MSSDKSVKNSNPQSELDISQVLTTEVDVEIEEGQEVNTSQELEMPGERLRKARQAMGLGQDDIASELRLDLKVIQALENGDLENLPGPMFTAGYLRNYARFVGLPADELVAQYVKSETTDLPSVGKDLGQLPDRYRKVASALPKSFSVSTANRRQSNGIKKQVMLVAGLALLLVVSWQSTQYLKTER